MVGTGNWVKLIGLGILITCSRSMAEEATTSNPTSSGIAEDNNQSPTTAPSAEETTTSEGVACRKVMMILAKRMMKHLNGCGKELQGKYPVKEEFQAHFQCNIRCFMQGVQMIDENFKLSNATAEAFLTQQIPEKYRELLRRMGTPCLNEFAPKLDPSDEYCVQYGEYMKCLQNSIAETC
ncbi:unnamed protein product [Allacma fusca]|uniref:Uncharacterized protein n=1 Tax=Allacma fusca TaxID=39272 RepID=A0A8J2NG14_9HEXA|nr:unnamed protein product [Allacma fusca]